MAILKILQYPDLRLRRKAYTVADIKSPKIQKVIEDMVETIENTEHCGGLSSTQLDMEDTPSIVVLNSSVVPGYDKTLCLINLEISEKEGTVTELEGCMSVYPDYDIFEKVTRAAKIKVNALDPEGNKLEFYFTGYISRCLQHELDHLCGILYIDHLSKIKRDRIDKKIAKMNKKNYQ